MTNFNPKMNEVNVVLLNGKPIRFVPVKLLLSDSGRSGDWHGWSFEIYRTKTGKILLGIVNWSSVQGETDYLHTMIGSNEKEIYDQLDMDNFIHRKIGIELQKRSEITETL